MTKREKEILIKLREIITEEIEHSKMCLERNEGKEEDKTFWRGAWVQAKEILAAFDEHITL